MLKVQLYAVQAEFNPCNSNFEGNLVALSHDTELFMDSQGLLGQVITVVSSGHVPMLKLFKALTLNSKSNRHVSFITIGKKAGLLRRG